MNVHDPFLRFEGIPAPHDVVGWTGPWPPPERIAVAHGTVSGHYAYSEDLDHTADVAMRSEGSIEVTIYERESYSKLPADSDMIKSGRVARGAQYRRAR